MFAMGRPDLTVSHFMDDCIGIQRVYGVQSQGLNIQIKLSIQAIPRFNKLEEIISTHKFGAII